MIRRRGLLLAGGVLGGLPGCRLIDQTTFNPEAGKLPVIAPAPVAVVPASSGPAALLVIPLAPEPDWAGPLRQAVAAARRRKPTVEFDVVAAVPSQGTDEEQVAAVTAAGEPAARVARAIQAAGVPAGRVRLTARPVPGLTASEVRVYVR